MNKKVLYGVILLSIFLMSAATTVQPVQGYKFGVPDQAKGVEGESEVKVYDEDQWESCFGQGHGADQPDDIWDGDSDVVGAKSKGIVKSWEKEDEIDFFWDYVLESSLDLDLFSDVAAGVPWYARTQDPNVETYKDAINYIDGVITDTALYYYQMYLVTSGMIAYYGANATLLAIQAASLATYQYWAQGTTKRDEAKLLFNPDYEGTVVTMDSWDYTDKAYKEKPNDKDSKAPFLADPESLWDSYETLVDMKTTVYKELLGPAMNGAGGYQWNGTRYAEDIYGGFASPLSPYYDPVTMSNIALNITYGYFSDFGPTSALAAMMGAGSQIPYAVYQSFEELIPKAGGFLYLALSGGLPVYTPTGKYLANMVEEFEDDIEDSEDIKETGHPDMDGSIPFEVSVDVDKEAMTITMKFEMDDYIDPAYLSPASAIPGDYELDDPDEMDDWKVTFYYSEYGSQNKIEYTSGGDVFYSKESLAVIPGYEITIILGASAIAILGLIYVIMKKRKI